jgi:CheY-like chemotaxis protein
MGEDKIKILCVEDEQDICENISEILRDEGFEVFEAHNGKIGFESFIKNKPDLIISDIMMPELDGYGLLKMIREGKNIRNHTVPFIFLSALGQREDVLKGVNFSANDYLIKPIDFDLLIAKVKEKTANLVRVKEHHDRDIKNIKNQVSSILPSDLSQHIDIINQISMLLRKEPYGPLPHRHYLEDINKIYLSSVKLKAIICNALDENVIDNKLNAEEEIFSIVDFIEEFIAGIGEKYHDRIKFDHPYEAKNMPQLKIDKLVFIEVFKKILSLMLKLDKDGDIVITVMVNHLDELMVIFYLKSKIENFDPAAINCDQINEVLDKQGCQFEISQRNEQVNGLLTIPSYRLISNMPN